MAVKERSQIKGTDAQIKAFAGHNGVLAFATDTKSLHVFSGTAGTTTEFLPSNKVATKTELANYTPTASLATVATSGSYNDLSDKPSVDSALSSTSENPVQNKVVKSALDGKLSLSGGTFVSGATLGNYEGTFHLVVGNNQGVIMSAGSNYAEGARLTLRAQTLSGDPGAFELVTNNGTTSNTLRGTPDGSLTWRGHNVISVVAESYSYNSWYRKYSDGWIEQGGRTDFPSEEKRLVITLPIAFSSTAYIITFCVNDNVSTWLYSLETTTFTVSRSIVGGMGIWWYTCGK